jgi:hypothetical protein
MEAHIWNLELLFSNQAINWMAYQWHLADCRQYRVIWSLRVQNHPNIEWKWWEKRIIIEQIKILEIYIEIWYFHFLFTMKRLNKLVFIDINVTK